MSEPIKTFTAQARFQVFHVSDWPEVDRTYAHMVVRLPGGYEFHLSETDAQRLGNALNRAGGGTA